MTTWRDLTEEQLTALPTHRLYTVYKLMIESRGRKRYDQFERGVEVGYHEMAAKCEFVKSELNTRPHIEREKVQPNYGLGKHSRWRNNWYTTWLEAKNPPKIPVGSIVNPEDVIGLQVFKTSKKPFKSKNIYNTVKALTINPHTELAAFTFEEDESIVDAHICNLRKVKNND